MINVVEQGRTSLFDSEVAEGCLGYIPVPRKVSWFNPSKEVDL